MKNAGMWASIICAIHCSIMPVVMVLLPTFGIYLFINETIELIILFISLVFNLYNICYGYKSHKSNKAVAFLAIGLFLFLVGRLMHNHNENHKFVFDLFNLCMISGGLLMAFSSYLNNKLCNTCKVCVR